MSEHNIHNSPDTQPGTPPYPTDLRINLSDDISSERYPLRGEWLKVTIINQLLGSFLFPLIVALYVPLKLNVRVQDVIAFVVLGITCGISLLAWWRVRSMLTWWEQYDFRFTDIGVVGQSVRSVYKTPEGLPILPYTSLRACSIKRTLADRLFGYAKLHLNVPKKSRGNELADLENIVTMRNAHLVVYGLRVEEAQRLEQVVNEQIMPKVMSYQVAHTNHAVQ